MTPRPPFSTPNTDRSHPSTEPGITASLLRMVPITSPPHTHTPKKLKNPIPIWADYSIESPKDDEGKELTGGLWVHPGHPGKGICILHPIPHLAGWAPGIRSQIRSHPGAPCLAGLGGCKLVGEAWQEVKGPGRGQSVLHGN